MPHPPTPIITQDVIEAFKNRLAQKADLIDLSKRVTDIASHVDVNTKCSEEVVKRLNEIEESINNLRLELEQIFLVLFASN